MSVCQRTKPTPHHNEKYIYNHTLITQQTVDATFSHVRLEGDAHHDSTKTSDDKFTRSRNAAGEPSTSRYDRHDHSKCLTTTNANVAQQQFSCQPARISSEHEPSTAPKYQSCRKHRLRVNSPSKTLSWSFGKQGILFESHPNNSTRFYIK